MKMEVDIRTHFPEAYLGNIALSQKLRLANSSRFTNWKGLDWFQVFQVLSLEIW